MTLWEPGLRRWMSQDDIDAGRKEGLWISEREAPTPWHHPGPVFVPLRGAATGERGLAPHPSVDCSKDVRKKAGFPNAERITGHSLRAGHGTEAHRAAP